MQSVRVSERVWKRLLEIRDEQNCICCGEWDHDERAALDLYGPIARRDKEPMLIGQIGQSLDGRVAAANGESKDVSGKAGIEHLHRMRALVDGVVIGVTTAIHDQSRLTVRFCQGPNPARIVIDPKGRLANDSAVFAEDGARRIVIQSERTERPEGVEVVVLENQNGQFNPLKIRQALRDLGVRNLMIEGGSFTIAKFIDNGLLDRLYVGFSPILIGSGKPGLTLSNQGPGLADAVRPQSRAFSIGSEVVFDCGLTDAGDFALEPKHK